MRTEGALAFARFPVAVVSSGSNFRGRRVERSLPTTSTRFPFRSHDRPACALLRGAFPPLRAPDGRNDRESFPRSSLVTAVLDWAGTPVPPAPNVQERLRQAFRSPVPISRDFAVRLLCLLSHTYEARGGYPGRSGRATLLGSFMRPGARLPCSPPSRRAPSIARATRALCRWRSVRAAPRSPRVLAP